MDKLLIEYVRQISNGDISAEETKQSWQNYIQGKARGGQLCYGDNHLANAVAFGYQLATGCTHDDALYDVLKMAENYKRNQEEVVYFYYWHDLTHLDYVSIQGALFEKNWDLLKRYFDDPAYKANLPDEIAVFPNDSFPDIPQHIPMNKQNFMRITNFECEYG